jgi:hypothetical protein
MAQWYEMTKPYWRAQVGNGMEMKMGLKEAADFFASLGYSLTKWGMADAGDLDEAAIEGEERVKAFAATLNAHIPEGWIEGVV